MKNKKKLIVQMFLNRMKTKCTKLAILPCFIIDFRKQDILRQHCIMFRVMWYHLMLLDVSNT